MGARDQKITLFPTLCSHPFRISTYLFIIMVFCRSIISFISFLFVYKFDCRFFSFVTFVVSLNFLWFLQTFGHFWRVCTETDFLRRFGLVTCETNLKLLKPIHFADTSNLALHNTLYTYERTRKFLLHATKFILRKKNIWKAKWIHNINLKSWRNYPLIWARS